ncbi:MAG: MOFRL family protein [Spirochaetia bacterium]|jgi:glycerate-2-kinase
MTDPRHDLRQIARAALDSVDPEAIIGSCLRIDGERLSVNAPGGALSFDLGAYSRIFVIGFGKASRPMARAVEGLLGARIDAGIIVVKPGAGHRATGEDPSAHRRLGYDTVLLSSHVEGECREVARVLAAAAKDIGAGGLAAKRPACLLAGGETTVTVRGAGRGGRNTETAVAFLREMEREPRLLSGTHFLSFSTDGADGPTNAAGGFASMALVM